MHLDTATGQCAFSSLDQMPLTWHMRNNILAVNFRSRPGPARVIAHAHNNVRQLALQPRGRLIPSCVRKVYHGVRKVYHGVTKVYQGEKKMPIFLF